MGRVSELISKTPEQTLEFGKAFGSSLDNEAVLCFYGNLGSGKTTFIKGLISSAAQQQVDAITSPTYVYLNVYEGLKTVFHFDLYRLKDWEEFISLGFDDVLMGSYGIRCFEWTERIEAHLPKKRIELKFEVINSSTRKIIISEQA